MSTRQRNSDKIDDDADDDDDDGAQLKTLEFLA